MTVESVSEIIQTLRLIESSTSHWSVTISSDSDSSRSAYESVRSLCKSIAITVDELLLDVENGDNGSSDEECDSVCTFYFTCNLFLTLTCVHQVVRESPSEKSARIAYDRSQTILSRIGNAITATEFTASLDERPLAPRQKQEDNSLIKLYRGYDNSDLELWVWSICLCLLCH